MHTTVLDLVFSVRNSKIEPRLWVCRHIYTFATRFWTIGNSGASDKRPLYLKSKKGKWNTDSEAPTFGEVEEF